MRTDLAVFWLVIGLSRHAEIWQFNLQWERGGQLQLCGVYGSGFAKTLQLGTLRADCPNVMELSRVAALPRELVGSSS